MSDEEKEFIKKVNIDKAKIKVIPAIILIIINLSTYIEPLIYGEYDFGIIFEIASFVFLIIARISMGKYDETLSKRYIIISIFAVVWLLIYDLLVSLTTFTGILDFLCNIIIYVGYEWILVLYLSSLFAINHDLNKANNPIKYKESTDWFYERYDEEKKE